MRGSTRKGLVTRVRGIGELKLWSGTCQLWQCSDGWQGKNWTSCVFSTGSGQRCNSRACTAQATNGRGGTTTPNKCQRCWQCRGRASGYCGSVAALVPSESLADACREAARTFAGSQVACEGPKLSQVRGDCGAGNQHEAEEGRREGKRRAGRGTQPGVVAPSGVGHGASSTER